MCPAVCVKSAAAAAALLHGTRAAATPPVSVDRRLLGLALLGPAGRSTAADSQSAAEISLVFIACCLVNDANVIAIHTVTASAGFAELLADW